MSAELGIRLSEWITQARIQPDELQLKSRATAAFVDTIGVIIAGADEPVTRIAAGILPGEPRGEAAVGTRIGVGSRTTCDGAAFINSVSGHALDFDDVSASAFGHPSVVLVPVTLAVGEAVGATGLDVLEAYVVGLEVIAKLGLAAGSQHYMRGWHATSTLGVVGSAASASRLLGLSANQTGHALAVAMSQAAGLRQNFGTMTKPFHAGHAARSGLLAAMLASQGMTGSAEALDGPLGFATLFSFEGGDRLGELIETMGQPWDLVSCGLSVKKYPCCFAVHRAVDGVLQLRNSPKVIPKDVRRIVVRGPAGAFAPLAYARPRTGLEGKFSMHYAVASALVDGCLKLDAFTDQAVRRPEVTELMLRVEIVEDSAIDGGQNPVEGGHVEVAIDTLSGPVAISVHEPKGGPKNPLSREQLAEKFHDCVQPVLGGAQSQRALSRIQELGVIPNVRDLIQTLVLPANEHRGG
jgi:2-methylcitrate dehydratase PrpD